MSTFIYRNRDELANLIGQLQSGGDPKIKDEDESTNSGNNVIRVENVYRCDKGCSS